MNSLHVVCDAVGLLTVYAFEWSNCSGYSWIQGSSVHQNSTSSNKRMQGPLCSVSPSTPAQVSSVEDLYEFICSGPLISKLGLTSERIADSIDKWLSHGSRLCILFQLNELYLTAPQKARLVLVLHNRQVHAIIRECVIAANLREANPGNALLEFRGNAGSHDLPFSIETLSALSKQKKAGMNMKLPRYDKSAYSGRGDRADPSTWPEVEAPLTVVLFEGWMLGFKPLPVEVVQAVDPQLEIVNKNLEAYYDAWDKFVKAWVVIKIQDPSCVYQWRLQAEIAMREAGNPGMTDEEVKDFVSHYLPAYKAYLPTLYAEGPRGSHPENLLLIEIDEGRNPILGN
ncbi:hypothetical protein POTOM_001447 [Populus tomentosa]|uniref:D-glycerate 3-kinase, chloroplastic n=1 Tax=Populus tomentosa TaxID=118781 RepID=A0A8X8IY37_POPTO|nr:hypothetical protein POTOM_001447 [Populus tomentosa]